MTATVHVGDALTVLRTLPEASVHCCVTSPPYWGLRDYGVDQQIGLEATPEQFVAQLVEVFREVRRVLRSDGVCWVNIGDSYATGAGRVGECPGGGEQGARWRGDVDRVRDDKRGYRGERLANGRGDSDAVLRVKTRATRDGSHAGKNTAIAAMGPMTQPNRMPIAGLKPKDLVGIPWRLAFALQADGWWLRSDCIWAKPNPMPESVEDRPTKAHEYVFLLTKSERYYYDSFAVRQAYADSTLPQKGKAYDGQATKDYAESRAQDPSDTKRRVVESMERRGGANLRTVWTIPTQPFKGAHFATFPKALADRCIMAGTSAYGCCGVCGNPSQRVVDSVRTLDGEPTDEPQKRGANNQWNEGESGPRPGNWRYGVDRTESGWRPTCACATHANVVPCRVLDPFTGAGTTALSATLLGRDFVGVELNPEFAAMARRRVSDEMPLFAPRAVGGST